MKPVKSKSVPNRATMAPNDGHKKAEPNLRFRYRARPERSGNALIGRDCYLLTLFGLETIGARDKRDRCQQ